MSRFFVSPENIFDGKIHISGTDVKHITRVLRMRPGDIITISDGGGHEYEAKISSCTDQEIICTIISSTDVNREAPIKVILVQGLPKGDKMEFIIQKCTELGVAEIIPVSTKRTVVQLEGKKAAGRRERWQRVAEEAAKQAGRTRVPQVLELSTLGKVLAAIPAGALALMPWEDEKAVGIKDKLTHYDGERVVYLFIGPEGGLASEEVDLAKANGVFPVTMGPRIMRTETAGLAALTMVLYQLGDLGGVSLEQ